MVFFANLVVYFVLHFFLSVAVGWVGFFDFLFVYLLVLLCFLFCFDVVS